MVGTRPSKYPVIIFNFFPNENKNINTHFPGTTCCTRWKLSWIWCLKIDLIHRSLWSHGLFPGFISGFTHTHTKCADAFLPSGCVYMQHPVQLVPNPQRVPRCHQPGQEDTRTGPEPLETHQNISLINYSSPKAQFNTSESIIIWCEPMSKMHMNL